MKTQSKSLSIIKSSILRHWYYIIGVLILCIISSVTAMITPVLYKKIIDDVIPNKDIKNLYVYIVIMVSIPILNSILGYFQKMLGFFLSDYSCRALRTECFSKVMHMKYSFFEASGAQELMQSITRGVGRIISVYILGDFFKLISGIIQVITIFSALFYFNWKIALIAFITIPSMLAIIKLMAKKISDAEKNWMDILNRGEKFILQAFFGLKTIRTFNGQEREIENFNEWMLENRSAEWNVTGTNNLIRTILPKTIEQFLLGVAFAISAYFVFKEIITIGILIAIIAYIPLAINSLNSLMSLKIGRASVRKISDELDSLLSAPEENRHDEVELNKKQKDILSLQNIEFTYGRDEFNLRIPKLTVSRGDFIAIVGLSGGGKSSVFDIVNRFYDVQIGSIELFGCPVEKVSTAKLRDEISSMLQDVYIFNRTIAENISYPDVPDKTRLWNAIKDAQLDQFIEMLSEGEETVVRDFGANFSGGECQRIIFARAIYKNASVFLLDEPTAALDAVTSKSIFDFLLKKNQTEEKTVILITHDISKALYANKILVIDNGVIMENGDPNELLKKQTMFRTLFESQRNNKVEDSDVFSLKP